MLTKNDCLMLLSELSDNGVDTKEIVQKLLRNTSSTIDYEVLKFINEHRVFDVLNFYEKLRVSYNNKKSKLYKSIVSIDEKEPKDAIVTLSSLLTQQLLFSNTVDNKQQFLKHCRADEVSKVLANYFKTYDLTLCIALLTLIKADLKVFESLKQYK